MEKLAYALAALALSASAAAAAADKHLAPAVKRVPSAQPRQPSCDPATASCPQIRPGGVSAHQYRSALRGAGPTEDVELDNGITNAMSRLMEAGRCADAVNLAKQAGRGELATRAQQLCK